MAQDRNRSCPTCSLGLLCLGHRCGSRRANGSNTSTTVSHRLNAEVHVHSHTGIQWNDFGFDAAVRNRYLFLACPWNWHTSFTPECARYSFPTYTWSLSSLQRNPHLETGKICIRLLCFRHDKIVCRFQHGDKSWLVLVIACRMGCSILSHVLLDNSRSIKCPVGHCELDTSAFLRDVRADVREFSHWFQFFLFGLVVIQVGRGYFLHVLCCFIRSFTKTFKTFVCTNLHVVTPWYPVVLGVIVELRNRAVLVLDETSCVCVGLAFLSQLFVCCTFVRWHPGIVGRWFELVLPDRPCSSAFATWVSSWFFCPHVCVIHVNC